LGKVNAVDYLVGVIVGEIENLSVIDRKVVPVGLAAGGGAGCSGKTKDASMVG